MVYIRVGWSSWQSGYQEPSEDPWALKFGGNNTEESIGECDSSCSPEVYNKLGLKIDI